MTELGKQGFWILDLEEQGEKVTDVRTNYEKKA